jgi:hypothetical protein
VPFHLNYDQDTGPARAGDRWLVNIQPVVPIELGEDWNLISRTILPVVWQDDIYPGAGKPVRHRRRTVLADRRQRGAEPARPDRRHARPSEAYRGYRYRILTSQGKDAPGGAKSYLDGGRMTGGYGFVAWPAKFGETGIMSFIVGKDGVV